MDLILEKFTDPVSLVIFTLAIIEAYFTFTILFMIRRQGTRLNDATDNLIKGFDDAPDKDSTLNISEKVESSLRFITNKIQIDADAKEVIRKNAGKLTERSADNRYFGLEVYASMMSTLVQVFPLLGILGTILAIAGSTDGSQAIDPSALSSAFVVAMSTTILGIFFSIVFMLIESALYPRIERVIADSKSYKDAITLIYLG